MRSPLGISIVAALALASGAGAAEKSAFTIPDLYRLKGVEEPALAPDGKTIVYKVTTSDLGAVKRQANLWRIDPDGANGRALTFADKADSFQSQAAEAAVSRLWGGIHFSHDNDQGLLVGRRIGRKVVHVMRHGAGEHIADRDD